MNTLVFLQGGHSTLVKGKGPQEVQEGIEGAIEEGHAFFFLEPWDVSRPAPWVCVDPKAVVALVENNYDSH